MGIIRRLKHVFLGIVGRRFSFFLRPTVFDTSNPLLNALSEEELKGVEGQVKEIYSTDLVQKHLRFLDGVESGVHKVRPLP